MIYQSDITHVFLSDVMLFMVMLAFIWNVCMSLRNSTIHSTGELSWWFTMINKCPVRLSLLLQTWNLLNFSSVWLTGNALPQDITCLAADRMLIFASYDNILHAFARNKEVFYYLLLQNSCVVFVFSRHLIFYRYLFL